MKPSRTFLYAVGIFLLALSLRLLLIEGWRDLTRQSHGGDYTLYLQAAEHFDQAGNFEDRAFLLRPPLFPALVAALDFDQSKILWVNAVFGALIAPLTYWLGCLLNDQTSKFSVRANPTPNPLPMHGEGIQGWGLLAGIIVACDPASIIFSGFLGPEPLANFFLLLMVLALIAGLNTSRYQWVAGLAAGGALVLSAWSRPAIYLLWLVIGGWLVITKRSHWRMIFTFVLVSIAGISAWVYHNGQVFDHYTISPISTYNLLYYRAASAEHLSTGKPIDEVYILLAQRVEEKLGRDSALVDGETRLQHRIPTAAEEAAMQEVAIEVLRDHPATYFATLPLGIARMYGSTTAYSGVMRWIDMAWNGLFLVGSLIGLRLAYRQTDKRLFWLVLLIGLYYTGGTLFVQTSGMDTRMRSMLTPFMALSFVLWGVYVGNYRRKYPADT